MEKKGCYNNSYMTFNNNKMKIAKIKVKDYITIRKRDFCRYKAFVGVTICTDFLPSND